MYASVIDRSHTDGGLTQCGQDVTRRRPGSTDTGGGCDPTPRETLHRPPGSGQDRARSPRDGSNDRFMGQFSNVPLANGDPLFAVWTASLFGVAPFASDSGTLSGAQRVRGGHRRLSPGPVLSPPEHRFGLSTPSYRPARAVARTGLK